MIPWITSLLTGGSGSSNTNMILLIISLLIHIFISIPLMLHAVLRKRDVRAVIGWVGLIALSPLFGSIIYACFGINRIERKGLSLKLKESWKNHRRLEANQIEIGAAEEAAKRYPNLAGLANLTRELTGVRLLPGNKIKPLLNGDEAYPAMIAAIDEAESCVCLLSYIFDNDRAGEMFADALDRAVKRGIEVRVLIDDIGARYSKVNMVTALRNRGINAAAFLPSRTPRLFKYANLRNHRKILVVDGQIGFTGGTNIREGHVIEMQPSFPVECLHFSIEGPVVADLQEAFCVDWAFATGEILKEEPWFPDFERCGDIWARGIPDGPDEDFEKLTLTIHGALGAARRSVYVVTPYFIPDSSLIHALNVCSLRGVDVRILLPAANNVFLVQWASEGQWWQLLERGCEIYLSPEPFDHTKVMVVDGLWSLIGSTNWDARSLRLNFEFNVECYSPHFAQELQKIALEKIKRSKQVTYEETQEWKVTRRLRNGIARLLSPYL